MDLTTILTFFFFSFTISLIIIFFPTNKKTDEKLDQIIKILKENERK